MFKNLHIIINCLLLSVLAISTSLVAKSEKKERCINWDNGKSYSECYKKCLVAECDIKHCNDPNWCENHCYRTFGYTYKNNADDFWDRTRSGILRPNGETGSPIRKNERFR